MKFEYEWALKEKNVSSKNISFIEILLPISLNDYILHR